MRALRRILLALMGLALGLGLVGGGVAALGRARWGDAGWYYHSGPNHRLRYGQEALRQGHLDRVNQIILLLEADGHKDQASLLRGESFFRQGKEYADAKDKQRAKPLLGRALEELNKVRDKDDLLVEAAALIGQCYLYLEQRIEAEQTLLSILSRRPDHIDAHRGLAAIYFDIGALPRAVMHLEKVAELDPQDGRPYRLMGFIYKDLGQDAEAISSYQKALARHLPEQVRGQNADAVRQELAECLVRESRYAEALEVLQQLDLPRDDAALAEALRGECLWWLDRPAEARAVLDQALADHAASGELLRARAKIHMADKEEQAAITLLQQALNLDRHDNLSRLQLVRVYESLGRQAEAVEQQRLIKQTKKAFDELTRLNKEAIQHPQDAAVRLRLAELCDKLDRPQEAEMWRQAAAACPPAPMVTDSGQPRQGRK